MAIPDHSDGVPKLAELETRRCAALVEGDFEALESMCHVGLRYTHSNGVTDTCESYLARCRSGYYAYERIECTLGCSTVVGGTVVFEERMLAQVRVGGEPRELNTRALVIWIRTGGRWQCLAYHAAGS